jgi:DNA topoisomerase I
MPALRHSSDAEPGYTRRRHGRGERYFDDRGRPVTDPKVVERIRALVIPPAWREVWICRSSRGHLQATGIDAAGRK